MKISADVLFAVGLVIVLIVALIFGVIWFDNQSRWGGMCEALDQVLVSQDGEGHWCADPSDLSRPWDEGSK